MDTARAAREFAAKIEMLFEQVKKGANGAEILPDVTSFQDMAKNMGSEEYNAKLQKLLREMDATEGAPPTAIPDGKGGYVISTGTKPLSMYDKEIWQKAFPYLFPYGDGVFGIERRRPMTFQQWSAMLMLRTELAYQVQTTQPNDCPLVKRGLPSCAQCTRGAEPFTPPSQPRWSADLDFLCVIYDCWRRMELVRRAGAHVRRKGFKASVSMVCSATSCELAHAFEELGEKAGFNEVIRSRKTPASVKEAVSNLLFFSSEVVGSDGARQQLRHEQMGDMLRFGGIGGWLTANVADTRHPLVVLLHAGVLNNTSGGLTDDGTVERYTVDLLEECPDMPKAVEMLKIIAKDPVAQARFFILSMQLFYEHVLGLCHFDSFLRHNGKVDGVAFPDGYATSLMGGAMNFIASLHVHAVANSIPTSNDCLRTKKCCAADSHRPQISFSIIVAANRWSGSGITYTA
jgi:hypothetical protein